METIYKTDFLMERLFKTLESKICDKKKLKKPNVDLEFLNKKTYIKNFREICSSWERDENHFKNFLEKELNFGSSINENEALILDGKVTKEQMNDVLLKYAKKYVVCKESECQSGNTEIVKENRVNFLVCKSCLSKKAIEE